MSWYHHFLAADKAAAAKQLHKLAEQSHGHFPPQAVGAVVGAIQALELHADEGIMVKTEGHVGGTSGGNRVYIEVTGYLIAR